MASNKFNAKNGLSVGVPPLEIIDNTGNALFLSLSVTGTINAKVTQSASAYHSDNSDQANKSTFSNQSASAYQSDKAFTSTFSNQSASAYQSDKATTANTATFASQATSAGQADKSSFASQSASAYKSDITAVANFAASATFASQATSAGQANKATFSNQSASAYQSDRATVANTATFTNQSASAFHSDNTNFATQSVSAFSADKLKTPRTINGVSFDGTTNINLEDRAGTPIASSATTTIGTVGLGETIHITGSATITSFGVSTTGTRRTLVFDNAGCILTHNAISLILNGSVNITTNANDVVVMVCENGALGYWRCVYYSSALISSTEMNYLDGVSGSVQDQLISKEPAFGILSPTKGGTGVNSPTQDYLYKGNGSSAMSATSISENSSGRVLVGATDDGVSKFQVSGQSSVTNDSATSVRGLKVVNNTGTGTGTGIDIGFATHDGAAVTYAGVIGATNISNNTGAYGSRTTYLTATGSGGLLLASTSVSSSIRFLVGSDANPANVRMTLDKVGNLNVTGVVTAPTFYGSLVGNASFASQSASAGIANRSTLANQAASAFHADNTDFATQAVSAYNSFITKNLSGGSIATAISTKNADYTLTSNDFTVCVSGNVTIYLPPAAFNTGRIFSIKKIDKIGTVTTINASGSELIDGGNFITLSKQNEKVSLQSDGTNWWIIASNNLLSTGYLQDFYTNRKFEFGALNNEFYLHELNYDDTTDPLNPLGIKINNDTNTTTYYMRVVNKQLELEEINFISGVANPTISDFENGCIYSLHVSAGEVFLKQDNFIPVNTVYLDTVTGKKYILIVEDATLKIVETDPSCIVNASTSASFKSMKDLYNGGKYTLSISGGNLITIAITATGDYKPFYHVKDYKNNIDYNLVIENGVVHIVEAYSLSLDEMFIRLDSMDTTIDELITTQNSHTSSISILDATDVSHSNSITSLVATDVSHSNSITSLVAKDTDHDAKFNLLSVSVSSNDLNIYGDGYIQNKLTLGPVTTVAVTGLSYSSKLYSPLTLNIDTRPADYANTTIASSISSASNTASYFRNFRSELEIPITNTSNISWMYGVVSNISNYSNVSIPGIYGGNFAINNYATSGTITNLYGTSSVVSNRSSGTVGNMRGSVSNVNLQGNGTVTNVYGNTSNVGNVAGTITNAYGISSAVGNTAGTITNAYGIISTVSNASGTIDTGYGVYISTIAGTSKWGLYSVDTTAPSYIGGNVQIGSVTPTASADKLQVAGNVSISGNTLIGGVQSDTGQKLQVNGNIFASTADPIVGNSINFVPYGSVRSGIDIDMRRWSGVGTQYGAVKFVCDDIGYLRVYTELTSTYTSASKENMSISPITGNVVIGGLQVDSGQRLQVYGNVGVSGLVLSSVGNSTTPTYSFRDYQNSGMYISSAGVSGLGFSSNGVELLKLKSDKSAELTVSSLLITPIAVSTGTVLYLSSHNGSTQLFNSISTDQNGNLGMSFSDFSINGVLSYNYPIRSRNDGGGLSSGLQVFGNTNPALLFYTVSGGVNEKLWDMNAYGNKLTLRTINDAQNTASSIMEVTRSGNAVSGIAFPNGKVLIGTNTEPSSGGEALQIAGELYVTYTNPTSASSASAYTAVHKLSEHASPSSPIFESFACYNESSVDSYRNTSMCGAGKNVLILNNGFSTLGNAPAQVNLTQHNLTTGSSSGALIGNYTYITSSSGGTVSSWTAYQTFVGTGATYLKLTGYSCPAVYGTKTAAGGTGIGFQSFLNVDATKTLYNFYASGTAPNCFMGNTLIGTTTADGNKLQVEGNLSFRTSIETITGNYTIPASSSSIICNGTAQITLTLPTASSYLGRTLIVRNIAAFAVISASANVVPIAGGTATTAIVAATAGKFAQIQSDGTDWQIMMAN